MLTKDQADLLLHKMQWEGFEYCFDGYSAWKECEDAEFHRLREAYVKAVKADEYKARGEAGRALRQYIEAAAAVAVTSGPIPCEKCEGCGKVASTEEQEPWSDWENLPEAGKLAIKMGLVRPVECPECKGTGKTN